jgi:hypothetical protein
MSLTNEELIRINYEHFVVGRNPLAGGKESGCFYRTPEGWRCAIGCAIPDSVYVPEMDVQEQYDTSIISLLDRDEPVFGPLRELFAGCNLDLLADLQLLHDRLADDRSNYKPEDYDLGLRRLTNKYGIAYPPQAK